MTDHSLFDTPVKPSRNDVPKPRSCLRCHETFDSAGFGERICRRCKGTIEWRNGLATTFGSSRRR